MLGGMNVSGWCRHCLVEGALTFEHLPPGSARNRSVVREASFPFDHGPRRVPREWAFGHGRPALCGQCQNNPPKWKYPDEYGCWRNEVADQLRHLVSDTGGRVRQGQTVDFVLSYDRIPGRFSRMALGMLLSCMDQPDLARFNPQLREAIGSGLPPDSDPPAGGDIAPWRLLLAVCDENWGFTTVPVIAPDNGLVVTFIDAPFAFYLYRGTRMPDPKAGVDITRWLAWGHGDRLDGPRKRDRKQTLPFRFNAYDYGEYHYMLMLGALYGVSVGRVQPAAEPSLQRLAQLGLTVYRGHAWELTEAGVDELTNAPVLEDRWQRGA
jgi:hypothetical protein